MYLRQAVACGSGGRLASALVAEGSLDNQGVAKPSDFYFTAGQQKFLDTARKILNAVSSEDIKAGLEGPWRYESELPSLGWDVTDDRVYALRAVNPSPEKKLTNPGPEALALLGLSTHPVFAGRSRTDTQGCSGSWKAGWYSWPLWRRPAFAARRQVTAGPRLRPPPSGLGSRPLVPWMGRIHNTPVTYPPNRSGGATAPSGHRKSRGSGNGE